jgi:hypothetical protein
MEPVPPVVLQRWPAGIVIHAGLKWGCCLIPVGGMPAEYFLGFVVRQVFVSQLVLVNVISLLNCVRQKAFSDQEIEKSLFSLSA